MEGTLPPEGSVHLEELLNHFRFSYKTPAGSQPLSLTTELGECPWASDHKIALIGLRTRDVGRGASLPNAKPPAVAADVKVQIAFNSSVVQASRLLGYDSPALLVNLPGEPTPGREISSGQTLTALYELVPTNGSAAASAQEWLTARVEFRQPNQKAMRRIEQRLLSGKPAPHVGFAAAVVDFGLLLREPHPRADRWAALVHRVGSLQGVDSAQQREDFIQLVGIAAGLVKLK